VSKWEKVKLGSINNYRSKTVNPNKEPNSKFELYSVPSYENAYPEIISGKDIGSSKLTVQKGDVLLCKINPRINRVWSVKKYTDLPLIASSEWIIIRSNKALTDYLVWCLKSKPFRNLMTSNVTGIGGSLTRVQPKQVLDYLIPLPPPETQKQIAKTLDTVSELLAMRQQQLAELDNLIRSVFYDMFGDPVTNEKGWEVSTIDNVCSKIIGGGTPSKSINEYYIGNIPWVTPKDMKVHWIDDSIDHINEDAIKNSSAKLIPANSILMVIRSGILKKSLPVAINKVDVTVNQDMKAFVPKQKVLKEYMLFYFIQMQNTILKKVRAFTADNIEFNFVRNLTIPIPDFTLQTQFASIVNKIEEQKALVQKAIDETQYLLDSLMSGYFDE
jgi:type I restriction enzyme S subunit